MQKQAQGVLKRGSSSGHSSHHIKWDQQNIKKHQQLQGTYTKITQPKTPYSQRIDFPQQKPTHTLCQQDLKLDLHLHQAQLNAERNQQKKPDLSSLNQQLMKELQRQERGEELDETQSEEARRKHEEFQRKRAEHYSEFKKIQQAKKKHLWEDD